MNKEVSAPIEVLTSLDLEMAQPSGKIISIGAVVGNVRTGEILDKLHVFVNPNEQLSQFIIDLTGIRQSDVDSTGTLEEAYVKLRDMHLKWTHYPNVITWGGGDSQELRNQLLKEKPEYDEWCLGRRWIDVKTLFISWRLANGKQVQGGLAKSMTKLGLNFIGRKHCAVDDAFNTFRTFCAISKFFKNDIDLNINKNK